MPLRFNCFLSLLFGFLLVSGGARAANLHIDASSPTGGFTISWSGFDGSGSFCIGGPGLDQCAPSGTATLTTPTGPVSFSADWLTSGTGGGGTTLYFVD